MGRTWIGAILGMLAAFPAWCVEVHEVRLWRAPDHTRIVFDLTGPAEHKLIVLENPSRIVLDVENTSFKAGVDGPFGAVVSAVTHADGSPDPAMYFWATGILSSFLDNAPTYLVFFNTAGGDPATLMGPMAATLTAISAGAVFMGANSYIGNAPNLMVKAVAEDRGVPMPSFFGYMAWSFGILVPLFGVMTLIFFR